MISYTIYGMLLESEFSEEKSMLFEHRIEQILNLLNEKNTVTIQELVSSVGVSESTIRRDLIALEEDGELRRIHGGATTVNNIEKELNMSQKVSQNQEEKMIIVKHAVSLVKSDSQIYVDAGTATLELIKILPVDQNIRVVTNGVDHALLAIQRGLSVTIVGGCIKPNTHAIAGITAYKQLEKMNFSYAFMGMNGLHEDRGLTTTNIDEAIMKEQVMKQSQNIRLLMDVSKMGKVYDFKVEAPTQAIVLMDKTPENYSKAALEVISDMYNIQYIEE